MDRLAITKSKPTVVVGLDFGTTFSGFAYALVSEPEKIHTFYEWPALGAAGGKNYCKTQTSLLYSTDSAGSYELEDWAYSALVKHANIIQSQQRVNLVGVEQGGTNLRNVHSRSICATNDGDCKRSHVFITRFKLHLAGKDLGTFARSADMELPRGLTVRTTISDYLRKLSELVMTVLSQRFGNHISMEDVQWCLTVPAIWDETAKQEMKVCSEIAGLVQGRHCLDEGASPHPAMIVLEPEAASVYCQQKAGFPLTSGDNFLVVDVGGGTVDLVLHEKVGAADDLTVREVSPSSGGFCGGTYVDKRFFEFLSRKIKCFDRFSVQQPQSVLKLQGWWETIKHGFNGDMSFPYEVELPAKLARAWEADEKNSKYLHASRDACFDIIDLSLEDMHGIFDPVIDEILQLIEKKMINGLKVMMVVGGFSASPYLVKRIKKAFSQRVEAIIIPNEPGSAICCGAVSYGLNGAELITSRISKLTYGVNYCRPFVIGDPEHLSFPGPNGERYCNGVFQIYVRNGESVLLDQCVSHLHCPLFNHQTTFKICLYSTSQSHPKYVDDSGVRQLGQFTVTFPSKNQLGIVPDVRVSLYFGRTLIEVKAVGENFGEGETFTMPPVTFESSFG